MATADETVAAPAVVPAAITPPAPEVKQKPRVYRQRDLVFRVTSSRLDKHPTRSQTRARLYLAGTLIATAEFGGERSAEYVEAEFRKARRRWTVTDPVMFKVAEQSGLLP